MFQLLGTPPDNKTVARLRQRPHRSTKRFHPRIAGVARQVPGAGRAARGGTQGVIASRDSALSSRHQARLVHVWTYIHAAGPAPLALRAGPLRLGNQERSQRHIASCIQPARRSETAAVAGALGSAPAVRTSVSRRANTGTSSGLSPWRRGAHLCDEGPSGRNIARCQLSESKAACDIRPFVSRVCQPIVLNRGFKHP